MSVQDYVHYSAHCPRCKKQITEWSCFDGSGTATEYASPKTFMEAMKVSSITLQGEHICVNGWATLICKMETEMQPKRTALFCDL